MSQTRDLLTSLKKCLRAQGRTYRDVADALAISEASVKRIFSEQTFSLHRLEEVCRYLDVSFYDLARMSRVGSDDAVAELSLEQERALAAEPLVLTYFYLLLTGRTPAAIAQEFGLDDLQQTRMLVRLNQLQLVDPLPNNDGRLRVGRRIHWRHNGPIRKMYQAQVQNAFMAAEFRGDDERMSFETGELTWPAEAHTLIEFGAPVSAQNAQYYLVVSVDIDGDNLICAGDFVRDFDASPFATFPGNPGSITIALTPKEADDCEAQAEHQPTLL